MSPTDHETPTVVLLAAPPLGVAAWDEVTRRLHHHGLPTTTPDLFDAAHAAVLMSDGLSGLVDALAETVHGTCLVSHGLANTLALHLAARVPLQKLVLCNGPIQQLDMATTTLARLPFPVAKTLARPALANAFLASSLALRRLVVNPYVMDREMVDRVTASWTADRTRRHAFAQWLRALPDFIAAAPAPPEDTLLVWGDEDILYPAHVADSATGIHAGVVHHRVPGARHLHPIERPWELADAVAASLTSDRL